MPVTLRELADKAGVSVATVSFALNNDSRIKPETRQRIHKLAAEMGYIPDARGRALATRTTKIVGVVVQGIRNPFYSEVVDAVKATMEKDGYTVVLGSYGVDEQGLTRYIESFRGNIADGVIFAPGPPNETPQAKLVAELAQSVPVVFIDGDEYCSIPVMKPDVCSAACQATEHLINLGHKRIAYAGPLPERRVNGYRSALGKHGIQVDESLVFHGDNRFEYSSFSGGIRVGAQVAGHPKRPTGLVCFNDEVAIGAIQYLTSQGIRVPDDISVTGIDDIDVAQFYNPALTTVRVPKKAMAERAAAILMKLMNRESVLSEDLVVDFPTQLVVRQSTSQCRS